MESRTVDTFLAKLLRDPAFRARFVSGRDQLLSEWSFSDDQNRALMSLDVDALVKDASVEVRYSAQPV